MIRTVASFAMLAGAVFLLGVTAGAISSPSPTDREFEAVRATAPQVTVRATRSDPCSHDTHTRTRVNSRTERPRVVPGMI